LVISTNEKIAPPPNNEEGMKLLNAILTVIDAEGRMPQASDSKLNEKFHRTFGGNNKMFLKIHPKDKQTTFAVFHYAGAVTYTVGSFLQKNSDRLPNEVDFLFETSESGIVPELWGGKTTDENASLVRSLGKKPNAGSIVAKFKGQITRLVETLDEVSER
jgi:myosin heavy subunit